jgi:hypothetical protein
VTPTIASFANATHNHQDNAGGSTLAAVALADGFTGSGAFVRAASPTLSGQLTLPVGSAGSPSLVFDSGNGIYSAGTDRLNFATAGVVRAEIDAAGNLGLGLTPSAWDASIKALNVGVAQLVGQAAGNLVNLRANSYYDGAANRAVITGGGVDLNLSSGQLALSTAPSVAAGAAQTFTMRLGIAADGALSLNTTVSGTASVGGVTPPASVQGYIAATINGVAVKIPYYAN